VYSRALKNGGITDSFALDNIYLSFFRLNGGETLNAFVGACGGVANRICEMSHNAKSLDELIELIKTKRYTDANLRRTMLYSLVGVTPNDLTDLPKEALILAADEEGREIISQSRKNRRFKLVTKPADLDMNLRQNILTRKVDDIFTLANGKLSASEYIKKQPYIG
jgi:predicted nucleotidyltransferase